MNNIKKFEELNENVTDVFTLVKGILKSELKEISDIDALAKKIVNKLTKGGYLRK